MASKREENTADPSVYDIDPSKRRAVILYCDDDSIGIKNDITLARKAMKEIGIDVVAEANCVASDASKVESSLQKVWGKDKDTSCIVVFVLGHGNEKSFTTETKAIYDIDKLWTEPKNCMGMTDIPKIFIIDTCRGGKKDKGFSTDVTDGKTDSPGLEISQPCSNMLVSFATSPGYLAFCKGTGNTAFSRFLHELCKLITGSTDDLVSILTEVNSKMIEKENKYKGQNLKQMPIMMSTLTRKLHLSPATTHARVLDMYGMDNKGLAVILCNTENDERASLYKDFFKKFLQKDFVVEEGNISGKLSSSLERVPRVDENNKPYSRFACCIITKQRNGESQQAFSHFPPYWKDDLDEFLTSQSSTFFPKKPKMFFMHFGDESYSKGGDEPDSGTTTPRSKLIPTTADILVYSVKQNHSKDSTLAVRTVIQKLETSKEKKQDLVSALTEANGEIAEQCKWTKPTIFSTLTKKLVFL